MGVGKQLQRHRKQNPLESGTIEGDSPVSESESPAYYRRSRVARSSWNSVRSWGDHPPRLSTTRQPIVDK